MKKLILKNKKYTLEDIYAFSKPNVYDIYLSEDAQDRITKSRKLVDDKSMDDIPIYGINTGFGKLSNIKIKNSDISKLQKNLILSHAVGVGSYIPGRIVRIIILLKIISFIKGNSGVSLDVVNHLIAFLNHNCLPLIPSKGSVGASGDLAPLSHMTLPLLGIGKVKYNTKTVSAKEA